MLGAHNQAARQERSQLVGARVLTQSRAGARHGSTWWDGDAAGRRVGACVATQDGKLEGVNAIGILSPHERDGNLGKQRLDHDDLRVVGGFIFKTQSYDSRRWPLVDPDPHSGRGRARVVDERCDEYGDVVNGAGSQSVWLEDQFEGIGRDCGNRVAIRIQHDPLSSHVVPWGSQFGALKLHQSENADKVVGVRDDFACHHLWGVSVDACKQRDRRPRNQGGRPHCHLHR
mmetsp:Transcript_9795/g.36869  ORF Transcript_9795/g.36869 Transcript_9795/m.36869 type:complete len:230 (+) Transcript_9795:4329-5018(+)